jgi:hypothetical protein
MSEDDHIDRADLERRGGDDSPPLMNLVHDKPYVRGSLTSLGRTNSEAYLRFLKRSKEVRNGQ